MKLYCPITIDLYKVYPLQVMEAQQGNVGRGAIVTLTAGSAVIDPTDETVEVYAKKPDGTVSWLECSVEDGKIKINFTNQMLMSPGMLQVELRMKDDEDDITTPIFMVKVNKSNVQSAGRSENELPLLDQIKKNAEDAKTAAEAAETAVDNKVTNPAIGAVGQILEIETVDDEGKPLTYKAVEKPESGVDKELSQIIHASKYGIVSDGFSDTVIVIGKDAAAGDVIKYVIEENSGDITVIYDNNDTGEFNITTIDHAGEAAGEKTLTAEKYCTYTFPSEMDVYLPFNIPAKTSQLTDDVGFAKQEEVGKLSKDIATKASAIKEKASGEVIVATDSAEAKPLGLAIDGKSEQTQYSGKNLLEITGETKTMDGVTFTVDKDGSVTVNGTPSVEVGFVLNNKMSLKGNTAYVLSGCPSGGSSNTYYLNVGYIGADTGTGISKTVAQDVNGVYAQIFVKPGTTVNNLVFKPMLRLATESDDTFEPFVGGKPSPNTEYKQEIRNIGVYDEASGKYAVEVKCTGKNEFDGLLESGGINLGDGSLNTNAERQRSANFIKVTENTKNTLSVNGESIEFNIFFYDADYKNIGRTNNVLGFITPPKCRYIKFYGEKGTNTKYDLTDKNIQLERGSVVTPFEPYREPTTATVYLDEPLRKGDKAYWNGGSKVRIDRNTISYKPIISKVTEITDLDGNSAYRMTCKLSQFAKNEEMLSNCFIKVNNWSKVNGITISNGLETIYMQIPKDELTDASVETAQNWINSHGVICEYQLAEPTTEEIDIDLGELSMFYPTTILSNDCNANMEVTYIADTKAYVDKKITEVITAML